MNLEFGVRDPEFYKPEMTDFSGTSTRLNKDGPITFVILMIVIKFCLTSERRQLFRNHSPFGDKLKQSISKNGAISPNAIVYY
jgi:hypothetical protein